MEKARCRALAPLREIQLSYRFIRLDLSSAFAPAVLFTAAALKAGPALNVAGLLAAAARTVLYFWLYTYTFCLSNQVVGVEEDRLNKPHRPIVVGMVSQRGALIRWIVVSIAFSLVGAWFGVAKWALLWLAVSIAHNFLGLARGWFLKCAFMSAGIVAQLAPAWEMVTPLTPVAWRWILVIALVIFATVSLQDLRDIAGDRALGRRTLPLLVGEARIRIALSAVFALLPLVIHLLLLAPLGGPLVVQCSAVTGVLSLLIAGRILLCRSREADHRSYLLYTSWYCLLLLCAILLF